MSASSSVTGGNTTIQRNLFNLEYYNQSPEIFSLMNIHSVSLRMLRTSWAGKKDKF